MTLEGVEFTQCQDRKVAAGKGMGVVVKIQGNQSLHLPRRVSTETKGLSSTKHSDPERKSTHRVVFANDSF